MSLKSRIVSSFKLSRRNIIILLTGLTMSLVVVSIVIGLAIGLRPRDKISIEELFKMAPLIDGHTLLPRKLFTLTNNQLNKFDLRENNLTHTDIHRMQTSGLKALFMSVSVHCDTQYRDAVRACLDQVDTVKRIVIKYKDELQLVSSSDGLLSAVRSGKIAIVLAVEAGHCIDSSLAVLRLFYELGVRYMTLTQNCNTPWAESWITDNRNSTGNLPQKNKGLSKFGKVVIAEMNRLGMIIDLSHSSIETVRQTFGISAAPVIFSHSAVYSICQHLRNVPDDILIQLKRHSGLLLITFSNDLVTCSTEANITQVANHFDHVRNLIGADFVGIGSDFDGVPRLPEGLRDVSEYGNLFRVLRQRGWSDEELEKVAGKNILRVFEEVEKARTNYPAQYADPNETLIPQSDLPDTSCRITPA